MQSVYLLDTFGSPLVIRELAVKEFPEVLIKDSHGRFLCEEIFTSCLRKRKKCL